MDFLFSHQVILAAFNQEILGLLIQITSLLLSARILGELAQKIGQPSVLGEIIAGIIIGPSLLGYLFPAINGLVIPQTVLQNNLLEVLTLIGAIFLLLIIGLEIDLPLIKHHSRKALVIAAGGLILPFTLGYFFSFYIPDYLLVSPNDRIVFGLFIATALSLSAIPVLAKVLIDLKVIRRDIGQITIAAGMVDDTIAWIILSVVLGLIGGELLAVSSVFASILKVILFVGLSFFFGRLFAKNLLRFVQNKVTGRDKILTLIVAFTFALGALATAIGLEAILGAFISGIIFAQITSIPKETIEKLESLTFGIFAPIFFASAGLKVNLFDLIKPDLLVIGILFILVSVVSKVAGVYLSARFFTKSDHWTALSYGFGLNARGAIQIIVATIGLSFGILTQEIYSLIIITAVLTSLMAPPTLKWTLSHVRMKDGELFRLQQEELLKNNFIKNAHRILLPVRKRKIESDLPIKLIEAKLLERVSKNNKLNITLLTVCSNPEKSDSKKFLDSLSKLFEKSLLNKKIIVSENPKESILIEIKKDYDLLIIGATERDRTSKDIFNNLIDDLVRLSPCPSIVVQSNVINENWKPSRILVPTNGNIASRRAAEVAFAIATEQEDQVHILKVIEEKENFTSLDLEGSLKERQFTFAHQIASELKSLGESFGVTTFTEIETGIDPESVILNMSKENNFDLIILGTNISPGTDKLYLGPRVERILNNCTCPVLVVNSI